MDDMRTDGLRPPGWQPPPRERPDRYPGRSPWRRLGPLLALLLLLAAAGAGLWWVMQSRRLGVPADSAVAPPAAPEATATAGAPAEPPVPEPKAAAPLAAAALAPAVAQLVGARAAATLLQTDGFARRFVTTLDNLAREQAPASRWPVVPAGGRFSVVKRPDGSAAVHPENAARYAPLVALLEGLDARAAVALYVQALPALQRAYEEQGFPKARFHDRMVAVIDHLLATPEAPSPLPVTLTEVKGALAPQRPWLRWEFADPAFERASAGRKILWRVGPQHAARLKAKLRELRSALQQAGQPP